MPKQPFLTTSLDIPDVRVLQTDLTKDGEYMVRHLPMPGGWSMCAPGPRAAAVPSAMIIRSRPRRSPGLT